MPRPVIDHPAGARSVYDSRVSPAPTSPPPPVTAPTSGARSASGGLLRLLGQWDGAAVSIGVAIGAGIFATPGYVVAALSDAQGPPTEAAILGIWLLGGLLVLLDAFVLAELAAMRPQAGGHYVYLRAAYGKRVAFLYGWCAAFLTWPASIAAVAAAATEYATELGLPPAPIALLVIVAPAAWHLCGLRTGAWTQDGLSYGKALALCVFAGAALLLSPRPDSVEPAPTGLFLLGVLTALRSVWWTYDGYADAVFVAEEVKDAGRAVPRALFATVGLLTVVYVGLNAAFLACLSPAQMASSRLVAADAAAVLGGSSAVTAVRVLALLAVLGGASSMLLSGPRISFAMARDGLLFAPFAKVNPRGTPTVGLLVMTALALLYWRLGSFSTLLSVTTFVILVFVALITGALFVLRQREADRPRPYRVPLYPYLPLLLVIATSGMVVHMLVTATSLALPGIALLSAGTLAYEVWRRLAPSRSDSR